MYTFTKCCDNRWHVCRRFYEWDRRTSHKQPYFIFFTDCGPTEEMTEVSAESAKCEVEEGCQGMEEGVVGVASGGTVGGGGGGGATSSEELDLDQVKGRMLTMAGLFEIWKNDLEVYV